MAVPPSPRPRGNTPLVALCLAAVLAAGAVVLDLAGPWQGWTRRIARPTATADRPETPPLDPSRGPSTTAPFAVPDPAGTKPKPPAPGEEPAPQTPEANDEAGPGAPEEDAGARMQEIYAELLADMPPPRPGDGCRLTLKDGSMVRGTIRDVGAESVTLEMEYGTVALRPERLRDEDLGRLFPELAARRDARRQFRRERILGSRDEDDGDDEPGEASVRVTDNPLPVAEDLSAPPEWTAGNAGTVLTGPGDPVPHAPPARVRFDAKPEPTPAPLQPVVHAFSGWLETQERRVGGKIARRLYAKASGEAVVLYLEMDTAFLTQDHDVRLGITRGMAEFWAIRSRGAGLVRDKRNAHVVTLDGRRRIIGGTKAEDAASVWAARSL